LIGIGLAWGDGCKSDSPTRCVGEVIFLVVLSACLWSASG
jgi:hypothetical protein